MDDTEKPVDDIEIVVKPDGYRYFATLYQSGKEVARVRVPRQYIDELDEERKGWFFENIARQLRRKVDYQTRLLQGKK